MCRFLVVKSEEKICPAPLLEAFANMAEKSRTFDGDWQGDGWGVAWLGDENKWQRYRSLKPVWKDREQFVRIPDTKVFTVHARSASFADQKGILEYNQPYFNDRFSFVFNGHISGVKLPSSIPGKIGAEKIWSLLQNFLEKNDPGTALEKIKHILEKNSKSIQALNIGLADKDNIYSLNIFSHHPECYQLWHHEDSGRKIICSEKLDNM
jgi:predicted glutamine amidotransferase